MKKRFVYELLALCAGMVACSPVIAISWNEFLFIFILVAVLLGLPLYRFLRRVEKFIKRGKEE